MAYNPGALNGLPNKCLLYVLLNNEDDEDAQGIYLGSLVYAKVQKGMSEILTVLPFHIMVMARVIEGREAGVLCQVT